MNSIGIIGAGAWGTALAVHAANVGNDVTIWAYELEVVESINQQRKNDLFLSGIEMPENLVATNDFRQACKNKDLIIFACPSRLMRSISEMAAPYISSDTKICVVSKGIENETLLLMTEVLKEKLPNVAPANITVLSGPSFAIEVAEGLPTDVVVASPGFSAARDIQPMLHTPIFRVYTSDDMVGLQLGGALKNVVAIGAGVAAELGLGHNAQAALITRGLVEMTRLGLAKGANPITFLGLAGMGDLILTCTSDLSRNRTLGRRIAKGESAKKILKTSRTVAEGFYAAKSAWNLAKSLNVDMPITQQVYEVLYEGKTIQDAVRELMTREYKNEFKGIIHA